MKNISLAIVFTLLGGLPLMGQGINFYHGSWDEALEKAKTEEKLIFVDAFASWCGPCKRMARDVFPDPEVGQFFNANFICMKIDMEKPENAAFASKYPVGSYPTLMFIKADGAIALKDVGAKPVPALLELGKRALGYQDNLKEMDEKYAGGERAPEFLYKYIRALNRAGKPSLKITNDYLKTQQDLTTPANLQVLLEGAVEADSRVFDLMVEHRKAIEKLHSADAVDNRVRQACQATVDKAIQFKSEELLQEAKDKMARHYTGAMVDFAYEADMQYYAAVKDEKSFLKVAMAYQKNEVKNNAARLHGLVQKLLSAFPESEKVFSTAEKWAEKAAENGGLSEYYLTLAKIYYRNGKKEEALRAARKAKEGLNENNGGLQFSIDNMIRDLDGGSD